MKKTIFLTICCVCFAINNIQAQNRIYVYGVDFSHVKVHAANESVAKFAQAFERINLLFIQEPEKYDFSRLLGKRTEIVIEPMLKHLADCDYEKMITYSNKLDSINVEEIIKNYTLPQTEGIGFVAIARMLNKGTDEGTYELVVFDIASREIIERREAVGEAGGAGLRNYWANSFYRILKRTKIHIH